MKKTAVYSLSAGILSGIFVVLVLTMTRMISNFADTSSFKVSIVAAVLIALLFDPLRNRIQRIVDKLFYKKTYDYFSAIQDLSQNLSSMFDYKKIYDLVGSMIHSTLGLRNIYLMSAVPGGDFQVVYKKFFDRGREKFGAEAPVEHNKPEEKPLKIEKSSKVIQNLQARKDIVIREEIVAREHETGRDTSASYETVFNALRGEAMLPVFIDGRIELLIILGEKLSGDTFTEEDIKLLTTIANQTSIALKNARLYVEKVSSERLASIGMVSATFAHEIRNPLTSIKTFAQLMPDKYADAEFREKFSKIAVDEIGRIDRLIRDLMSISSSHISVLRNRVELVSLLEQLLEQLAVKLEIEDWKIRVKKIYEKDNINVLGDHQKLEQSFMNIMNNGCQAMDGDGVLSIHVIPNGENVEVAITDTGKGIAPAEINKIFDPFYTTKARGVGLGLAISKKIIEDHGGTLAVDSTVKKGTTFTASLPVSA